MPTAMPYSKERSRVIREEVKRYEEAHGPRERLPHEKLVINGDAKSLPVYRLHLDSLAFNKANGRIKAEVLEKEAELGRQLDEWDKKDQVIIRSILLSIRQDENDKISEDLEKNGQMRPGIITCDGVVINGNRRKALLECLHEKTHQGKYAFLDVQVLPCDIVKSELWLIEAGIQLSAPQQLDYSPINHLLKLREGVDSGLEVANMAERIYGVDEETIKNDLERLDLIDEYLRDFIRKERKYYLVNRLNEHFIDLQEILSWAKRPRGNIRFNWKADKSDINELKLVGFSLIRGGFPHLRIRDLRELFSTKESWKELKGVSDLEPEPSDEKKEAEHVKSSKDVAVEEDNDTAEPTATPVSSTEEKDILEEASWRDAVTEDLHTAFEQAKEQKQIVKDSERPLALAKRALKMITAIPIDSAKLTEPEMDGVLREIISHTNELRKAMQKERGKSKKRK